MSSFTKPVDVSRIAIKQDGATRVTTAKRTNVRYMVVAMLFIISMLNNADRAILSITGTLIQHDLLINSITLGYLFSAFAWAYMLAQLPGGWLLDRFGSKKVYAASIFLWSLSTFLQGFVGGMSIATSLITLFILRICVGTFEGPAFPANSRVVTTWFPSSERGTASAIFNSAQYGAAVVFTPLMGWIAQSMGWAHVYLVMGGIGMLISVAWLLLYRLPAENSWANQVEIDYLVAGGALIDMDTGVGKQQAPRINTLACLKELLSSRMMLGVYAGQYFITTIVYFFLTWFPIYLVKALHMPVMKAGFVASIPAVFGFLGGILGGIFSDYLLKRGHSTSVARKIPIVIGLLMASSIVACNWASTQTIVIVIMAAAFFGKGLGSLGWTVVADTSPKEAAGLAGALFNTFANVAGITTPIVIGYIVERTGSFDGALLYVAINALLAVVSFVFIVGKIERITLKKSIRTVNPNAGDLRVTQ